MDISDFRTIAESIATSSDPHQAAVIAFVRREVLRCQNKTIYHFEDGSCLSFAVEYKVLEAGISQ